MSEYVLKSNYQDTIKRLLSIILFYTSKAFNCIIELVKIYACNLEGISDVIFEDRPAGHELSAKIKQNVLNTIIKRTCKL